MTDQLRDKDRVVLHCIQEGHDDVQKITAETTLENHHVTYAFDKLQDLGLIHVEKPEGMVERVIDGQKRVFQAPKRAELTEKGLEALEKTGEEIEEYEDLSHNEIVEKVHELENRMKKLEKKFDTLRRQVKDKLS